MKSWKYKLRLVGIISVGLLLLKVTYHLSYSMYVLDLIIFGFVAVVWSAFLIWSLFSDLNQFRIHKKTASLIPIGLGIVFITLVWVGCLKVNSNFDKPSLLRMTYDEDFIGTVIDFKTDSTYIYKYWGVGPNNYSFGTYKLNGNQITLDRVIRVHAMNTNRFEIQTKKIDSADQMTYVFQLDSNGQIMADDIKFSLHLDNRKN